ncbi:hypothetical protein DL96DRAFT_1606494 [Flagelloscypha sp. PMI_526]|nr:hypothetical protein DL96DRAFT_1606494 [Flagelloscypha sp. PMI_526]
MRFGSLSLVTFATSVLALVVPKDNQNSQDVATITEPVTFTETKVVHTLLSTSPWISDVTTTFTWVQYPPGQGPSHTATPTSAPPSSQPSGVTFTDTKVIHTTIPFPPFLTDITTVVTWVQLPSATPQP